MDTSNQNQPNYGQPQIQQTIVVVGKRKSVGVAFLLAFLFGPLGLLYASVTGGVIMFLLGLVIGIITFGFGLIFIWIGSIIWAVIAANNANQKMTSATGLNINTNFSGQPQRTQPTIDPPVGRDVSKEEENKIFKAPNEEIEVAKETTIDKPQQRETVFQSSFDLGNWFDKNKKSVLVAAGGFVGFLILIVAVKFVLSIDFKNEKSSASAESTYSPSENASSENIPETTSASLIIVQDVKLEDVPVTNSSPQEPVIKGVTKYYGTIGTNPIELELIESGEYNCERGGTEFVGSYYYQRYGSNNKLSLKGYHCGASIYLYEYDENGNTTGSFTGIISGSDVEGTWSNNTKQFDFKITEKE